MFPRRNALTRCAALLAAIATTALAAASLAPSAQAATCTSRTLVTPFSRFGDATQYFLAPAGSFEGGATGWSLTNAATASGNETYYLNSTSDKTSLKLTGSATSPGFCITRNDPMLRFVAKTVTTAGASGNYSQLNVSVIVKNAAGSQAIYYIGTVYPQGGGTWFVSPVFSYGSLLDSWLFGSDGLGTATMQVQFTVAGQGGTWYLDDLYVDPFAGR